MTGRRMLVVSVATGVWIGLSGCATQKKQLMRLEESQLELRNMQTRAFDSSDRIKMLRSVISTLQDFDYLIHDVNKGVGMVSATRRIYSLHNSVTVTVRRKGETRLLVRVNAEYFMLDSKKNKLHKIQGVIGRSFYQGFFTHLEKSMFLTAHEVD